MSTWKNAYKEDKQAKIETRVSPENKAAFLLECQKIGVTPADVIRQMIEYVISPEFQTNTVRKIKKGEKR